MREVSRVLAITVLTLEALLITSFRAERLKVIHSSVRYGGTVVL